MHTNHNPSVSVVIPAYQAEKWLPTLLEGLDRQTFKDFEVIFVNDGSTDNTGVILENYAASRRRVRVIHQVNKGVGAARNTGIEAAKGEYVVFIDADDAISESHLDDLFSLATSLNLEVAMCNGWRFREVPGDDPDARWITKPFPEKKAMSGVEWFELTLNMQEWWGCPWMAMIRMDFLRRHSIGFAEKMAYEDNLWNVMVQTKAKRVAYTSKQSYYYRWTPNSILNDPSMSQKLWRIESCMALIEKIWQLADSETSPTAVLLKRLAANKGRTLLAYVAELGSFDKRIAVSCELQKRGFLARMSRDVETVWYRKRILRAYGFAFLGMLRDFLTVREIKEDST
ncbi:MAG TPA: glycosyltransferase [Smithella sp.]|nr:glycosyltransferase [Smithella sp.]